MAPHLEPKPTVDISCGKGGYVTVRGDCHDAGCFDPECDVCHLHDEPADSGGNCEECARSEGPRKPWTDEQRIGSVENMFAGDRDVDIRVQKFKVVSVRKPQICVAHNAEDGDSEMPKGTRMVRETAVVDGEWGSNYVCVACADAWLVELNEIDPDGRR